MAVRYAERTEVSSEVSRMEIERILRRYGADQFMWGTSDQKALIAFRLASRNIRFQLPFPDIAEFEKSSKGVRHIQRHRELAREQAIRQRWRALALVIKAKLEAVACGITQVEEEFYANIVMPSGRTIYEETHAAVAIAYDSGKVVPLLPHIPT